ncbi:COPII subunit SEC24 KNAG_0E01910 [Huiozyma naganishii CBS 8797]|uniref:Protein transport protein SEC24 n=1 Tax=Huiozyma naganishii (strain ATCC MYA-139 / BCRC 22969 / CBS 8797 / KCTC 17520 / NBRC 10181 / NCYC 3082 / Yp74L-3) TaxID=1071383 RepID=J7RLP3_HUIN7|nr:hypothetical protein KNAG_0E01910 [Kazachstania naganishii CBS 8797]CCK70453.1 hypothetical protein KNAG_0E01910 [Kazachstania naganishii CBS 8797]
MSHNHKRRVYPQAQFAAGPASGVTAATLNPMISTPPPTQGESFGDTRLMTPVQQHMHEQLDQVSAGVENMQLHNVPVVNPQSFYQQQSTQMGNSVHPQNGSNPQVQNQFNESNKPMNELYTVDLMASLPPPITDLDLPPPPILVPADKMVVAGETVNASSDYLRCTLNAVPKTQSLLDKSKVPFALVIRPYQHLHDNVDPPPLNSDGLIVRCRRCRSYLNPFVTFIPQSRRWRCNFCRLANDLPMQFGGGSFGDPALINATDTVDRYQRNEVNHAVMEYIAPAQYCVREPPPPIFSFILDVSLNSIKNGSLYAATTSLINSLDMIPNYKGNTLISIICMDHELHYVQVPRDSETNKTPMILDVGDLDEAFLPTPRGLLVSLTDCKQNITKVLQSIPQLFQSAASNKSALGAALRGAFKLLSVIGGKIVVVTSTLPNIGPAALKMRDQPKLADIAKEYGELLTPQNPFYKSFPIECNKSQIAVDLFLTADSYIDVTTLSSLSRYTGGQTHFYPGFQVTNEGDLTKFSREFTKHLSMDTSTESVMRARGSRGIKMKNFYGHFFNRSSDLCALTTMPRDQSYVFEAQLDDTITSEYAYIQIAILHSSNTCERRIRIITVALPTTNNLRDVYGSADQLAIFEYFNQIAIQKVMYDSLSSARELLKSKLLAIMSVYKKEISSRNEGGILPLKFPANMRMLPLLLHALTKTMAFRGGVIPVDYRSAALNYLESAPLKYAVRMAYPTIYSLHDMPEELDFPVGAVNNSFKSIQSFGLYLIDNGLEMFLWVGGDAVTALVEDVFGVPSVLDVQCGKMELPVVEGSAFNAKLRNVIATIRSRCDDDSVKYEPLYIVRGVVANEPPQYGHSNRDLAALRIWAMTNFVEDKIGTAESYMEFLQTLKVKVNK